MTVLLIQIFSHNTENSKCSYTLSQISYVCDLEKHREFRILNGILRVTGTKLLQTNKNQTVPGKIGPNFLRVLQPFYYTPDSSLTDTVNADSGVEIQHVSIDTGSSYMSGNLRPDRKIAKSDY